MLITKDSVSDIKKDFKETDSLMGLLTLFDGDFSIDLIVEFMGCKTSYVVEFLEECVRQKILQHKGAGVYSFRSPSELKALQSKFTFQKNSEQKNRFVDRIVKDHPKDENIALSISTYLLQTSNNLNRCCYLVLAGDGFLKQFENQKAIDCYFKALKDSADHSGKEVDELFIDTALKFSKVSTGRQDPQTELKILEDALTKATRLEAMSSQTLIQMHIAKTLWFMGAHGPAISHFEKGWQIAGMLDNRKLHRSVATFTTFFLGWQGRYRDAVDNYEKSVSDIARFPEGKFPLLAAIILGYCYTQTGEITQGLGMTDAIRSLALEKKDSDVASIAALNLGVMLLDINQIDESITHLKMSARNAKIANNQWVLVSGRLALACCYYRKGETKRCMKYFRDFLKQKEEIKMGVILYPYLMDLLWAIEQKNLPPVKGYSLSQEVERTLQTKNIFMEGVAYRYRALLQIKNEVSAQEIKRTFSKSLKVSKNNGHMVQAAKTQLELAQFYLTQNNYQKARELTGSTSSMLSSYSDKMIPDDLMNLLDRRLIHEKQLTEILQMGQKIARIAFDDDFANQVIKTINRMTGAERGALFLLQEKKEGEKFILRASNNLTLSQVNDSDFSTSMKILDEVAHSGKARIIVNRQGGSSSDLSDDKVLSCICFPMIYKEKVVGVFYHDNRLLPSNFMESDLDVLAYFSAQAAFVMDNVRAYNEIRQLNSKLHRENEYYKEVHVHGISSNEIIGESQPVKRMLAQIEKVAQTEATIIILGETGVGKELVAKAIHNQSSRRNKPFIEVHCGALADNLIPSELFGHEKGAFTGAINQRIGRFELADGGTLFLDEIGEISQEIQIRLLRVLQTREFERVGGTKTVKSDFRLITATNKNLEKEIAENRFREDLFYRLNVFPIRVSPLRERREDIPRLAHYFLKKYASRFGKPFDIISDKEIKKLISYDWPGNVRELENVIERGCILGAGHHFRTPELAAKINPADPATELMSLREAEKRHIIQGLIASNWKIKGPGGAAELLALKPSTLYFRMKKLGIQKSVKPFVTVGEN